MKPKKPVGAGPVEPAAPPVLSVPSEAEAKVSSGGPTSDEVEAPAPTPLPAPPPLTRRQASREPHPFSDMARDETPNYLGILARCEKQSRGQGLTEDRELLKECAEAFRDLLEVFE